MRKIFALPAIFISLIGVFSISSCNNADNPVTVNLERNIIWQSVDSIENENIYNSFIISENDAVFTSMDNTYRIQNGNRTQLNFGDPFFYAMCGDGYSTDYFAIAGAVSGSRGVLKIFANNVITSVMYDSTINSTPRVVKIISPGKIMIASAFKVYLYDNGSVSLVSSFPPAGSGIYLMIQDLSGDFYFTANTANSTNTVFKLVNNSLAIVSVEAPSDLYLQTNSNFFRFNRVPEWKRLDIFMGDWRELTLDSANKSIVHSAGAEPEYQYFVYRDSVSRKITGKYRTAHGMFTDPNFPSVNHDASASYTTVSLMRDHAFYFTKYSLIRNKTYIYKSKLG